MQVKFSAYGLNALQRGFQEAPAVARAELLRAGQEAVLMLESAIVGAFPHHSGVTRASFSSSAFSTPMGVLGLVGSAAPVALFVELGTKPHTPPLQPLIQWVQDVLGKQGDEAFIAARGIQRKIRARGTQAKHVIRDTAVQHEPQVMALFEAAAGRVAAHLANEPGTGGAA